MRTFLFGCIALTALLVGAGCGDKDEETIPSRCEASCQVPDGDICKSQVSACINACVSYSNSIDASKLYRSGCGLCLAGTFSWYKQGTQCLGYQKKQPFDTVCSGTCFEPDAGVSAY